MRPLLAASLALIALPAAAQQPAYLPTRDVTVTYRSAGTPQGPQSLTMSWLAAQSLLRIDIPTGGPMGAGWMLIDQRGGNAQMVMEQQRMVMTLPGGMAGGPAGGGFRPSPNARFTAEGSETIAGNRCTNYRIEDGNNRSRACLTADGVLLRAQAESQGSGQLEATSVTYGAQDAARFRIPEGYQAMDMQQMMQGLQRQGQGQRPPAR